MKKIDLFITGVAIGAVLGILVHAYITNTLFI